MVGPSIVYAGHTTSSDTPSGRTLLLCRIRKGTETTAFGIVVPDFRGCFSAGGMLAEAIEAAEDAAAAWLDATIDAGQTVPIPSTLDAFRAGWHHVAAPRP